MRQNQSAGVLKETFRSWSEDKAPRLAAALTYYTIFSIAPLLVLVIAIAGFVIGSNAAMRSQVLAQVQNLVGPQGSQMVDTLITNTSRPRDGIIATVIGIIALVFGATGVFTQLKDALNTIWEVSRNKGGGIGGMLKERLSGLVMILGLGFLLLVSFVISTALSVLNQYFTDLLGSNPIVSMLINYGIQIVVLTIIFTAIIHSVPDVQLRWKNVWVGGLVTAILFLVGQFLISLYLTRASPSSAYGAAGSLVVLLLWLYYSSQILFLGAEFAKVFYLARGHEIVPTENAHLLAPIERAHQGILREEDSIAGADAPLTGPATVGAQRVAAAEPAVGSPRAAEGPSRPVPQAPTTRGAAPIPVSGEGGGLMGNPAGSVENGDEAEAEDDDDYSAYIH